MRRMIAPTIACLLLAAAALPALAAAPNRTTFLDKFSTQSYAGNDGTAEFEGPWIEILESNGPKLGPVWVAKDPSCLGGFCLKMGGKDAAVGHGVWRAVPLQNVSSAELKFHYTRELMGTASAGTALVQISQDGGSTWVTLAKISLNSDDTGSSGNERIDVTAWATSRTVIRFRIGDTPGVNAYITFDNIQVSATFGVSSTTTTTNPTTTTLIDTTTTTTTSTSVPTPAPFAPDPPDGTTTTTSTATTVDRDDAPGDEISPEDHDLMVEKSGMAVTSVAPPNAIPSQSGEDAAAPRRNLKPVEALNAAFSTDAGSFGGNLFPSIALGIVIAVLSLFGIGTNSQD